MDNRQISAIVIKDTDNVATAIRALKAGEKLVVVVGKEDRQITVSSDIKFLHKFALADIKAGWHIMKYGQSIGEAICDIRQGEHIHTHNLRSLRGQAVS